MKVLIIKLSSIGDVAQTLPALYSLKKGLTEKGLKPEIDWLVEEPASGLLAGHPLIDNVIIVKRRSWISDFKGNIKIARFLASQRYDMVLDFQGLLKSAVWVALSRCKRRIGFSNYREKSTLFLNELLPPYDIEKHAIDRYLDLARYAGGFTGPAVFKMNFTDDDLASVKAILARNGLEVKTQRFFVLAPYARWATKLWNDESFVAVATDIAKRYAVTPVLIGSLADYKGTEALKARIGNGAINLAGKLDLKELAALMKLSSFAVTVDSGPMHIAVAGGAKVIALFGPTAPHRTGPYGKGNIVIQAGIACSPCFKRRCADPKCMAEIPVKDVILAAESILKAKNKS
ncbi:glycosyltransferase family 9 protein [bacterium]|nr:MAG: glycosyltransferase family 9 protein [bacterium]